MLFRSGRVALRFAATQAADAADVPQQPAELRARLHTLMAGFALAWEFDASAAWPQT